eukprot:CAMPEP_0206471480 /NCGR_PEP_ID=MMETSP0324_2-20121206/31588_1 /ASSEMBLY_ACC=CAM_ASM_000836 /TAXON_ID=2866 /ORGANISM="Crypthecodinium cohnii, Strain Seligo" /LENGTH=148 /DNA_ID=CAMNT_0053945813 /DNA_START=24 /DNA_END=467 /DNA_ORIENTATION=+
MLKRRLRQSAPLPTCSICYEDVCRLQEGLAEPCGHSFCITCIKEWIRRCSHCPLCKREIGAVRCIDQADIVVEPKRLKVKEQEEAEMSGLLPALDEVFCFMCGAGDDEELLLLCDGCERDGLATRSACRHRCSKSPRTNGIVHPAPQV